jgi:DNA-binding SARP family transcriptional activator
MPMHGITFGRGLFETTAGRVEPDSDVHFGLLLIASAADREGASRDEICALLWPESPADQSRHSLRQALYRLRRLAVPIHLRGTRVVLNGEDTHIDLRRLMQGSAQREELLAIGTLPFLPGYAPKLGPRFSGWLDALRDRANSVRRFALVEAIREARTQARFRDIHKLARALLALDPLNETATLALAEALVMDGSKVEALRMLEEYEDEVGSISESLRIPVRTLRRRVSECLDDALLPRRFEVPFVGRDAEFTELRTMFVATRAGRGQCAVITGEAGIGKTRITNELLRLAVLDGAMAVTYSCTSGDALSPLSSLLTLTQALLAQPGALGCSQEHLQYLRRLNTPESNPPVVISGMGAEVAYAQLVYALAELVAAISEEAPLLIFVDDAQRLHATAWRIFTDLVDRLPDRRVLLVFATRQLPECYATLGITGSDGRARHLRLKALAYSESRNYLSAWSDKHGVVLSEEDTHEFAVTAEGNPFYLGELAGHVGRGGDARQAPASIRGLIELQYAATSRHAQRVLLVISLLQSRASLARVTAVLGITPSEFVAALEELELAGLVAATGVRLRVKHELVADVTVALGTPGVVNFLRARIAGSLEEEAEETDSVELLSDSLTHWEGVGDAGKVFAVGMRLGDRFYELGLGSEAHNAYRRADVFAATTIDRKRATEGQMKASFLSGNTSLCLKHFDEWSQLLDQVAIREPRLDLEFKLLAAEVAVAEVRHPSDCRELLALAALNQLSTQGRLRALAISAMAADHSYDMAALSEIREQLDRLQTSNRTDVYGQLARMVCLTVFGHSTDVISAADRFVTRCRGHDDYRFRLMGPRWASSAMRKIGNMERRVELVLESMDLALRYRLRPHQIHCWEHLCDSYIKMRSVPEAETALAHLANAREGGDTLYAAFYAVNRANLCYLTRDRKAAQAILPELLPPPPSQTATSVHAWLAARVGAKIVCAPDTISTDEINQLLALQRLGSAIGGQEDRLDILLEALAIRGNAETAEVVVLEYAKHLDRKLGPGAQSVLARSRSDHREGGVAI